jgi:heat shock protein HtpX
MQSAPVTIPPRRSLVLFALLAVLMVIASYLFLMLLAAACVYVPWLAVSRLPNFQTLVLFLGGIGAAAVMLWSLVPRPDKFKAPGLLLEPATHPRLFAEIENIAIALQEPLPREVYLIGAPNAFVADRGGMMGFGSRRVMGLGIPLLAALNVSQFRAILAHEFAHYYGGDTSLGPWLHRAQMTMIRTFQGIGSIGQVRLPAIVAVLYTVVFGILKWYWLLFLRAINFVSRRQEYRADELACIVAGRDALVSGLRGVHISALAWPNYWHEEVFPLLNSGCLPSITSGFSQFLAAPAIAKGVDSDLEAQIRDAKSDPYDSHPPLRDRIAAASQLTLPTPSEDSRPAWNLVDDMVEAELNFLEAVNPDLPKDALKRVSWEESSTKVLIPNWTRAVDESASLLQGITVANLPKSLGRVPEIAAEMRDPTGMLLTPEQRVQNARNLVGTAFALALVNNGWILHSRPGEFYLEKDGRQLQPFLLMLQLSDGVIWGEAWTDMCKEYGIENIEFRPRADAASNARQPELPFS